MDTDKIYRNLPVGVKAKIAKKAKEQYDGDISKAIFFEVKKVCTPGINAS